MDCIYQGFQHLTANYKIAHGTPINVDVLVPQNLRSGMHPIIFRFHGGGFTSGSSLYPGFFPRWILQLALAKGAIIVTPNYRLLPEANALDILEDLDDLWAWLTPGLNNLLSSSSIDGLQADLSRVLTVGESAGGYLSVQFALDHATEGVRATIAECASLDIRAMAALGGAQNFSSSTNSQRPADSSNPPVIADSTLSRFGLINEIIEGGRLLDYFPEIERVHPLERLNNGACMPPTFLIHGLDDRVVPCSQSEVFAKKILAQTPNANVHLELQPGDHLMDIPLQLGHPWLVKGIRLVTDAWLG